MLSGLLPISRWRTALSTRFGLALSLLVVALPLHAAPPVPGPRIGYLTLESPAAHAPYAEAFRQGLRERGYIEGKNISIEWRYAANDRSKVAGLAAELAGLDLDVLVADGTQVALVAKRATRTIPIVMPTAVDPVANGLVASLARPGGNVTGFALMSPDLVGKRLALLKEVAPNTRRVVVLMNPDNPGCEAQFSAAKAAAPTLGLELHPVSVRLAQEIDDAFSTLAGREDAVLITDDVLLDTFRPRIGRAAAHARLTSICGYPLPGDPGCLIMYGPDLVDLFPRAAYLVDRILKGAKPADLPVEQPIKFSLVINAKAAKAIGRTIPESVLVRADEILD